MTKKLHKFQKRWYIIQGHVSSLTNYFCVPKGLDDVRMVSDATQCGLNMVVSPPNFFMPTIDCSLRSVEISTWSGDIDLGEMFLNYILNQDITSHAGVDKSE